MFAVSFFKWSMNKTSSLDPAEYYICDNDLPAEMEYQLLSFFISLDYLDQLSHRHIIPGTDAYRNIVNGLPAYPFVDLMTISATGRFHDPSLFTRFGRPYATVTQTFEGRHYLVVLDLLLRVITPMTFGPAEDFIHSVSCHPSCQVNSSIPHRVIASWRTECYILRCRVSSFARLRTSSLSNTSLNYTLCLWTDSLITISRPQTASSSTISHLRISISANRSRNGATTTLVWDAAVVLSLLCLFSCPQALTSVE